MAGEALATWCGRYTYRLRMSTRAHVSLLAEWDRCRWVWNQCVAESKAVQLANRDRPSGGVNLTCGPAQLCKMLTAWRAGRGWLAAGASVPQQQVTRDFAKARAKAIKDVRGHLPVARRAGMPRFKKKELASPTLNYTTSGFRIKRGRLCLAGGIVLTVVWSRDLPATPSSVRVYRDVLGHWYASFVVAVAVQPLPTTGKAIGIDWGVRELATTTSDDHDLQHPEFGRRASAELARYQRMMARRRPAKGKRASGGYQKARRLAAKAHRKVKRQRLNVGRKWSKRVVRDHDVLAVEDFRPKFLTKSTMARKAADGAIGAAKRALVEMARKHDRDLRLVSPVNTTKDCGWCGARTKHRLPLSERIYTCMACGAVSPRDKNSARVMLVRAGLNPDGVDRTRPSGPPGPEAA